MNIKSTQLLCGIFLISTIGIASRTFKESPDAKNFYSSALDENGSNVSPQYNSITENPTTNTTSLFLRYFGTEKTNQVSSITEEFADQRARMSEVNNLNETTWDFDSTVGRSDAPVLVEIYQDIKCGMCRYAYNNIIPVLKEKYVINNKVRLKFKEYPLIERPQEMKLAVAAKCAGTQNRYEDYISGLYKENAKPTEESITEIAIDLKLDLPKFKRCIESKQALAKVKQDRVEATKLGVEGTPTFFVNGEMLVGAKPIESFTKIIDELLLR